MSDELRVPDDLAACEARLAAMPLAASRINRDELMYRAGWAAGVAGAAETSTSSARLAVDRAVSRRSTAALCAASAALAASLAVTITLPRRAEVLPAEPRPHVAANADEPRPARAPRVEQVFRGSAPVNFAGLDSGLIALRRQAIMNAWPPQASSAASLGGATAAPPTARDLMQDLLPAESPRQTGIWPWKLTPLGESI